MPATQVPVPGALLLRRELPASARLVWMILQGRELSGTAPGSQRQLAARYHLARNTVRSAMTRLRQAGWLTRRQPQEGRRRLPQDWAPATASDAGDGHPTAILPEPLLRDPRVGIQARVLYGTLQLTPGFRQATGQCTYRDLARLAGLSLPTVRRAVRGLAAAGWLQVQQRNQLCPLHFTLTNPERRRWAGEVDAARQRLARAPFLGEALMREYLTLLVAGEEYDDDASPGFLVNPFTGEEMEYDRYYPPKVAFEFNGLQHYGPTAKFEDEEAVRKQQGRDYLKRGISESRGITLVVVHPEDLTLANLRRKIGDLLPLRNLDGHEPLVEFLESASRKYRHQAARWS